MDGAATVAQGVVSQMWGEAMSDEKFYSGSNNLSDEDLRSIGVDPKNRRVDIPLAWAAAESRTRELETALAAAEQRIRALEADRDELQSKCTEAFDDAVHVAGEIARLRQELEAERLARQQAETKLEELNYYVAKIEAELEKALPIG